MMIGYTLTRIQITACKQARKENILLIRGTAKLPDKVFTIQKSKRKYYILFLNGHILFGLSKLALIKLKILEKGGRKYTIQGGVY